MHIEEPEEPYNPELQYEYAGGGPGSRKPTAIGMDDFGQPLDRSELPEPPWWWFLIMNWRRQTYEDEFSTMSTKRAFRLLESAGVPPIYRLGLGVRWRFLDWYEYNFSYDDFAAVLIEHPECGIGVSSEEALRQLDKIEQKATYQIWKRFGSSVLSTEMKENAQSLSGSMDS